MDKLQTELIKSNKETKAIKAEKQSCSEEVAVQKQKVKHLHYQLQQISNLTKVGQVSNHHLKNCFVVML